MSGEDRNNGEGGDVPSPGLPRPPGLRPRIYPKAIQTAAEAAKANTEPSPAVLAAIAALPNTFTGDTTEVLQERITSLNAYFDAVDFREKRYHEGDFEGPDNKFRAAVIAIIHAGTNNSGSLEEADLPRGARYVEVETALLAGLNHNRNPGDIIKAEDISGAGQLAMERAAEALMQSADVKKNRGGGNCGPFAIMQALRAAAKDNEALQNEGEPIKWIREHEGEFTPKEAKRFRKEYSEYLAAENKKLAGKSPIPIPADLTKSGYWFTTEDMGRVANWLQLNVTTVKRSTVANEAALKAEAPEAVLSGSTNEQFTVEWLRQEGNARATIHIINTGSVVAEENGSAISDGAHWEALIPKPRAELEAEAPPQVNKELQRLEEPTAESKEEQVDPPYVAPQPETLTQNPPEDSRSGTLLARAKAWLSRAQKPSPTAEAGLAPAPTQNTQAPKPESNHNHLLEELKRKQPEIRQSRQIEHESPYPANASPKPLSNPADHTASPKGQTPPLVEHFQGANIVALALVHHGEVGTLDEESPGIQIRKENNDRNSKIFVINKKGDYEPLSIEPAKAMEQLCIAKAWLNGEIIMPHSKKVTADTISNYDGQQLSAANGVLDAVMREALEKGACSAEDKKNYEAKIDAGRPRGRLTIRTGVIKRDEVTFAGHVNSTFGQAPKGSQAAEDLGWHASRRVLPRWDTRSVPLNIRDKSGNRLVVCKKGTGGTVYNDVFKATKKSFESSFKAGLEKANFHMQTLTDRSTLSYNVTGLTKSNVADFVKAFDIVFNEDPPNPNKFIKVKFDPQSQRLIEQHFGNDPAARDSFFARCEDYNNTQELHARNSAIGQGLHSAAQQNATSKQGASFIPPEQQPKVATTPAPERKSTGTFRPGPPHNRV